MARRPARKPASSPKRRRSTTSARKASAAPKKPLAAARRRPASARRTPARRVRTTTGGRAAKGALRPGALFAPVTGAERRTIGHVQLDVGRAGAARVKRMIYPPGFHWKKDMQAVTGTELCMHAHVGFLAHGEIHIEYADGCIVELRAPQIVAIDPGHDGWVVGDDPVVLIEVDFESDTVGTLGMPDAHRH